MEFVVCENCGKTMPKQVTGNEFFDSLEPEMVWCDEFCVQEWEDKQAAIAGRGRSKL